MLEFLRKIIFLEGEICYICKESKSYKYDLCQDCLEKLPIFHQLYDRKLEYIDRLFYTCKYTNYVKDILYGFENQDKTYLYRPLGKLMTKTLTENRINADLIISMPTDDKMDRRRGYSHVKLLASYLSKSLSIDYKNNLISLERTSNIDRIFRFKYDLYKEKQTFKILDPNYIENKKILIVGDFFINNIELIKIAKFLKKFGASRVEVIVFANGGK